MINYIAGLAPGANFGIRDKIMKFTLNISTHQGDLAILENDWDNARGILHAEGFDGYELYPVGERV